MILLLQNTDKRGNMSMQSKVNEAAKRKNCGYNCAQAVACTYCDMAGIDEETAKNLTQEELAALVNLSTTHVSVIERGLKVTKLDTFVAIANALDISADALLIDVVTHSVTGVTNELSEMIEKLPKNEQKRILNAVRAFVG